jgi:hypothetical protein
MNHKLHFGISELQKASVHRLDDARALFSSSRWRACMYVAGYSIECQFKVRLMKKYNCRNLTELEEELRSRNLLPKESSIFTHSLSILLRLAQDSNRLQQNLELWKAFNLVNQWVPAWRYSGDLSNRSDANDFLNAVEQLRQWIGNNL